MEKGIDKIVELKKNKKTATLNIETKALDIWEG